VATGNSSAAGGALYIELSNAILDACDIASCAATAGGDAKGGALCVAVTSTVMLTNCTIRNSRVSGGGVDTHGAGIYTLDSRMVLTNTTLTGSTGPSDLLGDGESIYSLAAPTSTTGTTYVLPAPAGRYVTPAFVCELIGPIEGSCGTPGAPDCPQVCNWLVDSERMFFNLSGLLHTARTRDRPVTSCLALLLFAVSVVERPCVSIVSQSARSQTSHLRGAPPPPPHTTPRRLTPPLTPRACRSPLGHYCDGSDPLIGATPCPSGQLGSQNGLTSPACAGSCPPGA
jgi:hypothetical protein